MLHWFPRLSVADGVVVVLTIGLCLLASRVPDIGDFVGHRLGFGKKRE